MGRKLVDISGGTDIWGSRPSFQSTKVPPNVLFLMKGASLSNLSSEFKRQLYSFFRCFIKGSKSWPNKLGSLKNKRSGEVREIKCFRLKIFRFKFSMFQVTCHCTVAHQAWFSEKKLFFTDLGRNRLIFPAKSRVNQWYN